jgi:hypothetical protein
MLSIDGHLLNEPITRAAAALPDVSLARRQLLQQPRQALLPAAPEVLHVVVRPAGEVRRDHGPPVPELRLKIQHHALFLGRKLAAPGERRNNNVSVSVVTRRGLPQPPTKRKSKEQASRSGEDGRRMHALYLRPGWSLLTHRRRQDLPVRRRRPLD